METTLESYKEEYKKSDLTDLIKKEDHEKIVNWIRNEKLSLQSYPTGNQKSTLMRQILDEAENGDEIIKKILDSFVTKTSVGTKEITSNSYNIKVDFSSIISENDDGKQESVLNDLVQLWLSYKSTPWERVIDPIKKVVEMFSKEKTPKKKSSPHIILGI